MNAYAIYRQAMFLSICLVAELGNLVKQTTTVLLDHELMLSESSVQRTEVASGLSQTVLWLPCTWAALAWK
jgi:hypothetical protein